MRTPARPCYLHGVSPVAPRDARRPSPGDGKTLLDAVWDAHTVRELPNGDTQLFIGLHLIHEVTSPQAFSMLRRAFRSTTVTSAS